MADGGDRLARLVHASYEPDKVLVEPHLVRGAAARDDHGVEVFHLRLRGGQVGLDLPPVGTEHLGPVGTDHLDRLPRLP